MRATRVGDGGTALYDDHPRAHPASSASRNNVSGHRDGNPGGGPSPRSQPFSFISGGPKAGRGGRPRPPTVSAALESRMRGAVGAACHLRRFFDGMDMVSETAEAFHSVQDLTAKVAQCWQRFG